VEDCVVLPDAQIGRGVRLWRVIVDKRCVLPDGTRIGFDAASDSQRYHVTERGIVLVAPDMLGHTGLLDPR
jgi:glucose-1-phosphate adenylyltransferase